MAIYTQLSPTATPGKRYSFSAKTEAAAPAGPHTGLFTELSSMALPGPIHSFSAKTEAAAPAGPHTGLFTALSAMALPGMRHSFTAKKEYVPSTGEVVFGSMGNIEEIRLPGRTRTKREEREIIEIMTIIAKSGILN